MVGTPAHARPARIAVFEVQAYAAPDETSQVVHTFVEGAEVSVSEVAKDGWVQIRLPDGRSGFVRESLVAPLVFAPPPSSPSAQVVKLPDEIKPRLVRTFDELRPHAATDPLTVRALDAVDSDRRTGFALLGGSAASAAAGMVGFFVLRDPVCAASCGADPAHVTLYGAGVLAAVLAGVALGYWPDQDDLEAITAAHSARNPEAPLLVPPRRPAPTSEPPAPAPVSAPASSQ